MKSPSPKKLAQSWKASAVAGLGLAGVGLAAAVIVLYQIVPMISVGKIPNASFLTLAIESTVSIVLIGAGFALMVASADPFEEFDFPAPSTRPTASSSYVYKDPQEQA
ncbi:hypothetical protein KOR42_37110 [Thalassoglobus neptunius]|uniref:Uncharacterized protein n=1 Tax=Thalassoglobus neptunius TaxID=1938619 RepID=A0A5C5WHJ8_9PLAN|nr:hypothetical protein [Thalassoglobus neptunius]TWT50027.1 hypothetical protein KOR42_37110 [Thalassoglobus neptunius]